MDENAWIWEGLWWINSSRWRWTQEANMIQRESALYFLFQQEKATACLQTKRENHTWKDIRNHRREEVSLWGTQGI
jgi:hypothetical protein